MVRNVLLIFHVGAGVAGLLTGPAAMAAVRRGRSGSPSGAAYLAAVTVLTVTAAGLVALRPAGLWPFLPLAAGTQGAVVAGRRAGSHPARVRLVCGSYVSLVTALLVVSWGSLLAWVLPTAVGTFLVERAASPPRSARRSSRIPTPSPLP